VATTLSELVEDAEVRLCSMFILGANFSKETGSISYIFWISADNKSLFRKILRKNIPAIVVETFMSSFPIKSDLSEVYND
jgi:hypothetical protein